MEFTDQRNIGLDE
jgi:hypothetical protein